MAKMAILMAEWERRAILTRVNAGIEAARKRGVHLGRPRRDIDVEKARELMAGGAGLRATARELGLSHRTLARALEGGAKPLPKKRPSTPRKPQ